MLISVFKSNQKIIILIIILLVFVLWIPTFWNTVTIHISNQLPIVWMENIIKVKWLSFLSAVILISFQAIYLNNIINSFKIIKNNTYLTALIFILLNSAHFSLLILNPIILANTFIILALHQLLKVHQEKQISSISFNAGLLFAFAILIYPPTIAITLLIWITLIYFKPPNWREFIVSLIGITIPIIYYLIYCFLTDQLQITIANTHFNFPPLFNSAFSTTIIGNSYFYILATIILFAGLNYIYCLKNNIVKVRKSMIIILVMFVFLGLTIFLNKKDYIATYLLTSVPISIILANFLNTIKKEWLANGIILILFATIIISYLS